MKVGDGPALRAQSARNPRELRQGGAKRPEYAAVPGGNMKCPSSEARETQLYSIPPVTVIVYIFSIQFERHHVGRVVACR